MSDRSSQLAVWGMQSTSHMSSSGMRLRCVVDKHPRYHQRCSLESWHIRSEITTMNRDSGNLPQTYNLFSATRSNHTPRAMLDHSMLPFKVIAVARVVCFYSGHSKSKQWVVTYSTSLNEFKCIMCVYMCNDACNVHTFMCVFSNGNLLQSATIFHCLFWVSSSSSSSAISRNFCMKLPIITESLRSVQFVW